MIHCLNLTHIYDIVYHMKSCIHWSFDTIAYHRGPFMTNKQSLQRLLI